jgi:hypothetical protein
VPVRNEGSGPKKKAAPVRPDDRAVRPVPPPAPRPVVGEGPKKPAAWARDRKVDEFARQVAAGRIQGRRGLEAVQRLGLTPEEKRRLQELTREYSQETQRDVHSHLARGTASALASGVTLPLLGQTERETRSAIVQNVRTLGGNPPPATDTPVGGMNWWLPGLGPARGASSKLWNNKRLKDIADEVQPPSPAWTPPDDASRLGDEILAAMPEAKRLQPARKAGISAERGKRFAAADAAAKEAGGGEAGYLASIAELRGVSPKVEFNALKNNTIDKQAVDQILTHIQRRTDLRQGDKLSQQRALRAVVRGQHPTPRQIEWLEELFGPAQAAKIVEQASLWRRGVDTGIEVINIPRALQTTLDISGTLRQNLMFATSHPQKWAKTLPTQFRALGSKEGYQRHLDDLATRENADRYDIGGLSLTDLDGNIATREEALIGVVAAERLPIVGRPVSAVGRAYAAVTNRGRADWFDHMVELERKAGGNIDDPTFLKAIGNFANTATGRGGLGPFEFAAKGLVATYFSPRLISSRLQFLINPSMYVGRSPAKRVARREARRAAASLVAEGMAILFLADKSGLAEVGLDPRSADFGKIKVGNTRVDIWGGFQQYVVAAARAYTGERVNSETGEVSRVVDPRDGDDNRLNRVWQTGKRLSEQKLAPVPGFVNAARKGETFTGDDFNLASDSLRLVSPIGVQSAVDTYREYGFAPAAVGFGVNALGLGVNTYNTPRGQRATQRAPEKAADAPDEWMAKVARYLNRPIDQIPAPLRNARLAQLSVQERQENLKKELGLRREPNDRQKAAIKIDVLVETQPAFRQVEKVLRQQIRTPAAAKVLNKWLDEKLGYGLVEEWSRKAGEADAIRKLSRVKVAK